MSPSSVDDRDVRSSDAPTAGSDPRSRVGAGRRPGLLVVTAVCALTACGTGSTPATPPPAGTRSAGSAPSSATATPTATPTAAATPAAAGYRKVLVVMEENQAYRDIIGSPAAPYLNRLAHDFGTATAYQAGYPARCPSLASYLLLTSGSDHGICDDAGPAAHPISGDNLFQQVAAAGQQWRVYAESMPEPCATADAGSYVVRHTAAPYYVSERARCRAWDLPLGSLRSGALHDTLGTGLPAFSLVVPDTCHDMHGEQGCPGDHLISTGDTWLSQWIPQVMAAPDYRAGRLVVIITWDESSSSSDNHIATLVISPTTRGVSAAAPQTHCTTLHTIEDLLHLPALGCAARTASATAAFRL